MLCLNDLRGNGPIVACLQTDHFKRLKQKIHLKDLQFFLQIGNQPNTCSILSTKAFIGTLGGFDHRSCLPSQTRQQCCNLKTVYNSN